MFIITQQTQELTIKHVFQWPSTHHQEKDKPAFRKKLIQYLVWE